MPITIEYILSSIALRTYKSSFIWFVPLDVAYIQVAFITRVKYKD